MRGTDSMELRSAISNYSSIIMSREKKTPSPVETLCDSLKHGNWPAAPKKEEGYLF